MSEERTDEVSVILQGRCGRWSIVQLADGQICRVFDVAWGRDIGDDHDHITSNISPGPEDPHEIDFFFTSDVISISDPSTGELLYSRKAAEPSATDNPDDAQ